MITEDNIATAQIAQIFGSELLKVQSNAQTDSGAQPHIVNINPKQFLIGQSQMIARQKSEEQRLLQMLQREAEAQCPLDEVHIPPTAQPISMQAAPPIQTQHVPMLQESVWHSISHNLERIASALERGSITVKKKRAKRLPK